MLGLIGADTGKEVGGMQAADGKWKTENGKWKNNDGVCHRRQADVDGVWMWCRPGNRQEKQGVRLLRPSA